MNRYLTSVFILLLVSSGVKSQPAHSYPQNYYRNPLNISPSLAGNFGDLRTNHYHMGLDFRTGGQENLPVVAAADGYVSHVRVEPYGYGRAIFITHPNGTTTLYGHLNLFFPALETFTRDRQYATQSWQQDIDLLPNQFPVRKGQFIAWSGNTGGSQGPHLHFEIRDSGLENGHNRNPIHYGLGISDRVQPVLYRLGIFNRNSSIYENGPQVYRLQKKKEAGETFYTVTGPVVKVPYGKFSLGLSMEDKTDNSFLFGVYETALYLDDSLQNCYVMDESIYEDSRYINAGIDYYTRYNGGGYMQHLSRLPGNHSPYFDSSVGNGVLEIMDDTIHRVEIEVSDAAGNTSFLRFGIQRDSSLLFPANGIGPAVQTLVPNTTGTFETNTVKAIWGPEALYDTVLFRYYRLSAPGPAVSDVHSMGDYRIPVHHDFTMRIKATQNLPDSVKAKTLMVMQSGRRTDVQRCNWQGQWAEAGWRYFGRFYLKYDNQLPTLRAINVYDSATFIKDQKLVFDAFDETGDLQSFNGYIDGQWVMFRQKGDRYTYDFDDRCLPGWHTLEVKAKDLAGNEAIYTCSFLNGR